MKKETNASHEMKNKQMKDLKMETKNFKSEAIISIVINKNRQNMKRLNKTRKHHNNMNMTKTEELTNWKIRTSSLKQS